ncbi:MAG: BtpA/SgcQ family protein [Granulosicoccaceae bacterium]
MNRAEFHQAFDSPGPVVIPVIHVLDIEQTALNIDIALDAGVVGVFLINHDFAVEEFTPIVRVIRQRYPTLWMGLNFLAVTGEHAFPILGELQSKGFRIDAYWADDACIDESASLQDQTQANKIQQARKASGWNGLYLGGTCFKKQREVSPEDYGVSAELATHFMDGVCTSGFATGVEADTDKIKIFRERIGEHVLALASGITPDNAAVYSDVDCFMVATGINLDGDFYNIDKQRLMQLLAFTSNTANAYNRGAQ